MLIAGVTANCLHPGYVATEIFTKDSGASWNFNYLNSRVLAKVSGINARTLREKMGQVDSLFKSLACEKLNVISVIKMTHFHTF